MRGALLGIARRVDQSRTSLSTQDNRQTCGVQLRSVPHDRRIRGGRHHEVAGHGARARKSRSRWGTTTHTNNVPVGNHNNSVQTDRIHADEHVANPGPTQRPNRDRKNHRFDTARGIEETTPGARVCDLDAVRSQANRPQGAAPRNAHRLAPAPRRVEARSRQPRLTALPHRTAPEPSGHRSRDLLRRRTTRPEPRQPPPRRFVRGRSSQRPVSRCQTSPARLSAVAPGTHAGFTQWGVGWPPPFGSGTGRASGRAARCRARTRPGTSARPGIPRQNRTAISCRSERPLKRERHRERRPRFASPYHRDYPGVHAAGLLPLPPEDSGAG